MPNNSKHYFYYSYTTREKDFFLLLNYNPLSPQPFFLWYPLYLHRPGKHVFKPDNSPLSSSSFPPQDALAPQHLPTPCFLGVNSSPRASERPCPAARLRARVYRLASTWKRRRAELINTVLLITLFLGSQRIVTRHYVHILLFINDA